MSRPHTLGLVGYGRINRALAAYVADAPDFEVEYVLVRTPTGDLPDGVETTDPAVLTDRPVDLVVEGATPAAVGELGERALEAADLLVLSGSAFVDPDVEARLTDAAAANGTRVYLPHAALLGIDGLYDARDELDSVAVDATKAPDHLDWSYTDGSPDDVDGRTVIYEGPTRGLCERFPRNFNSHAAVALASLGLDDTRSRLVADPEAEGATHVISASGEGFDLEITRESDIEGVTGDYTLVSLWGSVRRVLDSEGGIRFV
ncbi:aspartate dehydrogenase domain-containing protein [Candidatus Halobonum tyrrellensis]|uniref:Aspartate dehydrogenase n=1 Tax=Candidatus Halobonum tyrrellensis G22 TaxID=1324957 RepID=V4IWG8_9EURY|nr:aspartate dehydrogenase domain-containing protein [Candidatus Halobonum tyrrellensis]ESP87532.1 aspartate dehydrogenase [Candidatus Halobonum tyrrellensis G22]